MSSEKIKKNVAISILKEVEIDEVISFYNRIYNETRTREKFVWEFHNAPSGEAIYVVANAVHQKAKKPQVQKLENPLESQKDFPF